MQGQWMFAVILVSGLSQIAHAGGRPDLESPVAERPWVKSSPWNVRPKSPVFGDASIPNDRYFPAVQAGKWSLGVFVAERADGPVDILPLPGRKGIWDPDLEAEVPMIRVEHWPADLAAAEGSDGHADLVDRVSGRVMSFFQLRKIDGHWHAAQYAWAPLNGSGWGTPAHYMQGARAAGVPAMAGLIRRSEASDGKPSYNHALAMSLTYSGLAASPSYVFPATSTDRDAERTNVGKIPMGSLLMLPPTFAIGTIQTPALQKIARTLQERGAYVVDRNVGTPFVIYAEIGSELGLHRNGWDVVAARDLRLIQTALRPVISAEAWLDDDGVSITPESDRHMLSLRGPWDTLAGPGATFDGATQSLQFREGDGESRLRLRSAGELWRVKWARPVPGRVYRMVIGGSPAVTVRAGLSSCPGQKIERPVHPPATVDLHWVDERCRLEIEVSGHGGESLTVEMRGVSK